MNDAATFEVPDGFSLDAGTNERWFHPQEVVIAPVETLKQVLDRICEDCWKEWIGVSIKVINEYRLNMAMPDADTIYENHLREFLAL